MIPSSTTLASLAMMVAFVVAPNLVNAQNAQKNCVNTLYPNTCVPTAAAEYLGAGINYFGNPKQLTGKVLIISKGTPVLSQSPQEAVTTDISGESFAEFSDQLAAAAGLKMSYGGFSAAVAADYSTSSTEKIQRNYSVKRKIFRNHRYFLQKNPEILQRFVTDDFKKQSASLSGDDIIDAWGTHVVLSSLMGAKFELRSSSSSKSKMSKQCFDAHAEAKYNGLMGSGSATLDTSKCSASNRSESNFTGHTKLMGGDPSDRAVISANSTSDEIKNWSLSTGQYSNQAHVGAGACQTTECAKSYQIPIWMLIRDPRKSVEVFNAFKRRIAAQSPIKIFQTTSKTQRNHVYGAISVPSGWKILSGGARVNNKTCRNTNPMLLTASYFDSQSQSWVARAEAVTKGFYEYMDHRFAFNRGSPVCPYTTINASMTTFAVAIKDPWNIWKVKQFNNTQNGNIKSIKGKLSVKVDADYTLVGGGASLQQNDGTAFKTGSAYEYIPGLITASYPQKNADGTYQWVSSFTNGASYRAGSSALRTKKTKTPNITAWDNWYQKKAPTQSLLFQAQAIGIKSLIPNVKLRPRVWAGQNNTPAIEPQSSIRIPAGCAHRFTGGGAEAFFNPPAPSTIAGHSPFMLTQSFPETLGVWSSKASNDSNYTNYFGVVEHNGNKYGNIPRRYSYFERTAGGTHNLSTVKSYAMTFQVEPVSAMCD